MSLWAGVRAVDPLVDARLELNVRGTVHVVDDDVSVQATLRRLLQSAGYEVRAYSSAQQFLERLPNEDQSGCLIVEARLPGQSGLELQDRLREVGSTLPIVFISGQMDIQTTVKVLKAGAEDGRFTSHWRSRCES